MFTMIKETVAISHPPYSHSQIYTLIYISTSFVRNTYVFVMFKIKLLVLTILINCITNLTPPPQTHTFLSKTQQKTGDGTGNKIFIPYFLSLRQST